MNQSTVAERFNAASDSLELKGHRVIVRKARFLLEGGKADEAVAFLEDAGKRMRGMGVDSLAATLREWHDAGGDPGALVTDPEWVKGAAKDHLRSHVVTQVTHGADLDALAEQLVAQNRAQAAGEPLAGPPAARVAPSKLPPLPRKATDGKKSLGDVFSRPAVEAPSRLEERDLDLAEAQEVASEDEAMVVNVERKPPPAATSDDVLKLVSQPPEDFPVVPPARTGSGSTEIPVTDLEEVPDSVELTPPTSAPSDVSQPPAEADGSSSTAMYVLVLVLAGVAAAIYWFTNR